MFLPMGLTIHNVLPYILMVLYGRGEKVDKFTVLRPMAAGWKK
jgi:hypothetical protein